MATQPGIVQHTEQPYVAIRALVTMQTLGEVLPGLPPGDLSRRTRQAMSEWETELAVKLAD